MADEDGGGGSGAAPRAAGRRASETEGDRPSEGGLLERLAGVRSTLARERDLAPALWLELVALPAGERLARIAAEPRFQTFGLCELLLARATAMAPAPHTPPVAGPEVGHLAALALAAAERLDDSVHAASIVHDLKARAWAEIGEARRAAGELRSAEEALAQAAACLTHGSGDLLVDARLLEFEAAVRIAQGRPGEADALLRQAAARYAQINEPQLAARALARREEIRTASLAAPAAAHPAFGTTI